MSWGRYCYREVLPFVTMIMVECGYVVLNTLFKAAASKGMSYYVFTAYSFAIATVVLVPFAFIFHRNTRLPPFKLPLFYKICLLGLIGSFSQILGYKGIEYSSPTLASAIGNLTPAFTFILAVFFRMETLVLRRASSRAKIIGTILSISGAFIVVLYKGPVILRTSPQPISLHLSSPQSNWIFGGLFLTAEFFLLSLWYIVQAQIMKDYPAELVVVFLYCLCATIIAAPVCLILDTDWSDWKLRADIALVAIVYSGLYGPSTGTVLHTWGLRLKGPVYVASFNPLSIAIAAAMSVIFLGDSLYLGSIVGAIVIAVGFYLVMWGKAKDRNQEDIGNSSLESPSTDKRPLLQGDSSEQVR